jgi:hypothetical protein
MNDWYLMKMAKLKCGVIEHGDEIRLKESSTDA